ncbi:RloB family protein [Propionibacterium australiense]|uniref:RloB-like protein n=1 Tax=Propionibacterium australiense TaxID=119981 RepID=A0A383S6A6_9ACTN|nr:RloB family protein [Propionibacterium australiense]SYZ33447.1 RloB-like protein [Propionibacterium australiense]VEH91827.1 Uncharacterised protein [Propionibacterium australiense]
MSRHISRKRGQRDERTTILLVTNGGKTEKSYLEALKRKVPRDSGLSVQIRPEDGKEPETILRNLERERSDLSGYDEIWIIVDHDGRDRQDFLAKCEKRGMIGVVSVPCFEVWLIAHYEQVRLYREQADAQRHYRQLTELKGRDAKGLPDNFPFDRVAEAAKRCCLTGKPLPAVNAQGPSPSTTMPHLLRRLGLLPES